MIRLLALSLLGAMLLLAGCARSSTPAMAAATAAPAQQDALTLVSDTALSPRLHELIVHSPALGTDTGVRLLLPAGYDENSPTRYPVLYLLHGCCDVGDQGYQAWTTNTDVEAFTATMPLLIVMPMSGKGGFYADWYNNGAGGTPRWETHHIRELLPWIEAHYRVRSDRAGRMLAGLSMGGHGSFTYGAKYPDLFASAAAYSPVIDTNTPRGIALTEALAGLDLGIPGSLFGLRPTEEVRWRGHNPWDLAENLAPLKLYIRTGNGNQDGVPVDPIESIVNEMAHNVHDQLDVLGIAHSFVDYGDGTHSWTDWQADLHATLPEQLAYAQSNPPPPETVTYRSIDPQFSVFGWSVSLQRNVLEFARLGAATAAGFTLSGSGAGAVMTPAFYAPGENCVVRIDGKQSTLAADASGRLHLAVDL
ncbi:MAG TPA: alpha/beta hydrolase family protein, partial [Nevskiaceae bacterium]|nr:alpha/beta hydrolase family protein [Nevskiaceae bacterium]